GVPLEASDATLVELRIGDRAAFLFHPRLAECGICPQQLLVLLAFNHVLLRGPRFRHVTGVSYRRMLYGDGVSLRLVVSSWADRDRRQARSSHRQRHYTLDAHTRPPVRLLMADRSVPCPQRL